MPDDALGKELLEELDDDGEQFFSAGFWNNIIDLSLTVATILASLVATGMTAADPKNLPRWLIPTIAGIPAAAAAIQKTVRVRDRSNWYFLCAAQVRSLATRLKYASSPPDVERIANERARLELAMEIQWTKIGSSENTETVHHPDSKPGE